MNTITVKKSKQKIHQVPEYLSKKDFHICVYVCAFVHSPVFSISREPLERKRATRKKPEKTKRVRRLQAEAVRL